MRVIARSTLLAFWRRRVESSLQDAVYSQLDEWYKRVSKANWNNSAELKSDFGAASIVTAERVVFNIKGNEYRLIARVRYIEKRVVVLWIGTHKEYDRIDVKEVQYDKRRYFDSSDPR